MLERLVFKVEFYDVVSVNFFYDGKENLNCSFRYGFCGMRFAKFNFITIKMRQ